MQAKGEDAATTVLPIACDYSALVLLGHCEATMARDPYPARTKIASTCMAQAPISGFGAENSPLH